MHLSIEWWHIHLKSKIPIVIDVIPPLTTLILFDCSTSWHMLLHIAHHCSSINTVEPAVDHLDLLPMKNRRHIIDMQLIADGADDHDDVPNQVTPTFLHDSDLLPISHIGSLFFMKVNFH